MDNSNIELFNEVVGKIFSALYKSFPVKLHLSADLIETDVIELSQAINSEEAKRANYVITMFYESISWLIEEGYIRAGSFTIDATFIYSVVLSEKGLNALNQIPDSLTPKVTYGAKLVDAVEQGTSSALSDIVKNIFIASGNTLLSTFSG